MEINHEKENGIVHITIKGRLDAETVPEAKRFIEENVDKEVQISKNVHKKGGQIVLCCPNDIVRGVIGSIQLPIAESVTDAIKKFS
jgi:anti-anti-sigma regulatory factor